MLRVVTGCRRAPGDPVRQHRRACAIRAPLGGSPTANVCLLCGQSRGWRVHRRAHHVRPWIPICNCACWGSWPPPGARRRFGSRFARRWCALVPTGPKPNLDFLPALLVEPRRACEGSRLKQRAIAQLFDDDLFQEPSGLALAKLAAVVVVLHRPLVVVPDLQQRQLAQVGGPK
jgi:hypothetical protein